MKTPDKIYITTHNGETISSKWATIPFRDFENTAYICKDVLIEWIQEVRAIPHENAIVRDLAFQEVINKLNSM